MFKPRILAGLLAVTAGALFASGAWLHWRDQGVPRVTVLSGEVLIGGQPARLNSRLPGGVTLIVSGQDGAVTLQCEQGVSLTLSSKASLIYRGRTARGRSYFLDHGTLFVRNAEAAPRLLITSSLGAVEAGDSVFEVFATAMPTGIAIDTPRIMRLSVGKGMARISLAGKPGQEEFVRAGVKAELREGLDRILASEWLNPGEWKRIIGHRPGFADAGTAASAVPSGVWIPRHPGRKGATPGSQSGKEMRYLHKLRGAVLRAGKQDYWHYLAAEDRWNRVAAEDFPAKSNSSSLPAPPPDSEGVIAYSPRARAFLFHGRVKGVPGTWKLPAGGSNWRWLDAPANPPPRVRHALCYDVAADLFILVGGDAHGRACDDLWVLRLSSKGEGEGGGEGN
jgi:hypothetical protein